MTTAWARAPRAGGLDTVPVRRPVAALPTGNQLTTKGPVPLVSEETTAPSGPPSRTGDGWIANVAARLARVGADPGDDEDLRQKKALLVLLAVLIAPISAVWGTLYLAFGSAVGIAPFVYLAISVASLLVFARTRNFRFLLLVQLLDILIAPTVGGQMLVGGFLPSGAVGLWGILAPLGALVFLEVRQAIRWFVAFLFVFLLTGILGEVLFADADLPIWFTSTMLALNISGAGAVAFTLLAFFANQRNAALGRAPDRAGEGRSAPRERPPELDRGATEGRAQDDRGPLRVGLHPLRRRRGLHAARAAPRAGRGRGRPRSAVLPLRHARRAARAREDQDDRRLLHGRIGRARSEPGSRAQGRTPGTRHAGCGCEIGDRRPVRARTADRHQLGAGRRRRDRHEALPLRPLGRRGERREPDGDERHPRRDPDHARDVRAAGGRDSSAGDGGRSRSRARGRWRPGTSSGHVRTALPRRAGDSKRRERSIRREPRSPTVTRRSRLHPAPLEP